MLQLTLNDIVNIFSILDLLSKKNIPFNISFWVVKNLNICKESYNFFVQERQKLYQTYLYLNDEHSYLTQLDNDQIKFNIKDNEQTQEFVDKFNELLSMKCEIQPYTIKLSILINSDIEITPEQLAIIECLIDETE